MTGLMSSQMAAETQSISDSIEVTCSQKLTPAQKSGVESVLLTRPMLVKALFFTEVAGKRSTRYPPTRRCQFSDRVWKPV
jgi:hypothetical protein